MSPELNLQYTDWQGRFARRYSEPLLL